MVSTPRAGRDSRKAPEEILKDLAQVLSGDQAVYLCLGPEGAVLSMKPRDAFAYGEAIDVRWHRMSPEARAQAVLGWIRKAAKYCRKPRIRWVPA
jgi:hypothetical protein